MQGPLTAEQRKRRINQRDEVARAIEVLLGLPAKEVVPEVELLRDYLRNPRFNIDLDKVRIDQAIEKLLDLGLNEFLDPRDERNRSDERHSIQFGVYRIKVRPKKSDSAAQKLFQIAFPSHKEPNLAAESLWDRLVVGVTNLNAVQKKSLLKDLNLQIQDLYGCRVIVLSQRCKFNIARAMNLVANHASDQFLRRINDELKERRAAEGEESLGVRLFQINAQPWLIFNPPAGYLYSSPASVQSFFDALNGYDYGVMKADSRTLGVGDAGELEPVQRQRVEAMGAALDSLQGIEFKLSFRPSGYATFQRTFECEGLGFSFRFELQVRTLLEDAWAEPEHRLSYKPDRPMSERTKMMFRNYGAQLAGADDLLQIITDLWEEETREQPSLFENVFHNYPRHKEPEGAPKINPDLERFYMLRNNGYLSTALAFMRRMIQIYDGWSAEVDAMLLIEEAVTMAQMAEDDIKTEVAVQRLERVYEIATQTELKSEQFSSRFRLASCELQKVRLRIERTHLNRSQGVLANLESVAELDSLIGTFAACYEQVADAELSEHLKDEYHIGGIFCDIVSHQAQCLALKALAGEPSESLSALEAARERGEECFLQALREVGLNPQRQTFIPRNTAEFEKFCVRARREEAKKGEPDPYRIERARWFAIWGCNIVLYSVLICGPNATSDQIIWAESAFAWLAEFKPEYGRIRGFVTSPNTVDLLENKEVETIIDSVAMQELKVVHSLIWYGYCSSKLGFNRTKIAICMGAIRHRLVQICCLGEHGFERGFFDTVNDHLRIIKDAAPMFLGKTT